MMHTYPVRLHIAGSGNGCKQLEEKVKSLHLTGDVIFNGWVEDVRSWLTSIDLVVIPSREETFGIAILEAHAHGRPVVSTTAPGPTSQITHGVNGWIAQAGDPQSLAGTISQAIQETKQWPQIIGAGRDSARTHCMKELLPVIGSLILNAQEYDKRKTQTQSVLEERTRS